MTALQTTWPTAVRSFDQAAAEGRLDLPLPGHGHTRERLLELAALGREDLVLARLAEGHADALAILAELGGYAGVDARSQRWGVWAAVPRSLTAVRTAGGWRLSGDRPWCSGAGVLTHALVTAADGDDVRLFAVRVQQDGVTPRDGTWPAVGMAGSDSRTVTFDDVRADPVGDPGAYVHRPGFWHGGIGVAACWYGGATGVADALLAGARPDRPHVLAHLGAVGVALGAARAVLMEAADRIDADPKADAELLAFRVRAGVEQAATSVLDHVGRALGAGPLCTDGEHARRVADLTVYLRQSHAEADLAHLGELLIGAGPAW